MRQISTLQKHQKQRGSVLFIMLMILVALTTITLVATNIGRTDIKISNAYTEQSKSFIKGEEMLARLRYALEQIPLPEGINNNGDLKNQGEKEVPSHPILPTQKLASYTHSTSGEPDFKNPTFAPKGTDPFKGWLDGNIVLTCKDVALWMEKFTELKNATADGKFEPLDCHAIDPDLYRYPTREEQRKNARVLTIIELVNQKQNEGDIDELHNTYYYRITIRAKGETNGQSLIQGVTGIQYN